MEVRFHGGPTFVDGDPRFIQAITYVELNSQKLAPTAVEASALHILEKSTFGERFHEIVPDVSGDPIVV